MKVEDVRVGMTVRIRDWEDMAEEARTKARTMEDPRYRATDVRLYAGSMAERFCFVAAMRHLCGREFEVSGVGNAAFSSDHECELMPAYALFEWLIEPWMVTPVTREEPLCEVDPESIFSYLYGQEGTP